MPVTKQFFLTRLLPAMSWQSIFVVAGNRWNRSYEAIFYKFEKWVKQQ